MRPVPIQPSIAARSDIAFSLPGYDVPTNRLGEGRAKHKGRATRRILWRRKFARYSYSRSQPQIVVSAIRVAATSLILADHVAGVGAGSLRWAASQRARSTTACP